MTKMYFFAISTIKKMYLGIFTYNFSYIVSQKSLFPTSTYDIVGLVMNLKK